MRVSIFLGVLICLSSACDGGTSADGATAAKPAAKDHGGHAKHGDDGDCQVDVSGPATTKVGETAIAKVSLRPGGNFEVNQEAPLSVMVGSTSLTPSKASYGMDDASVLAPREVTLDVPFTSAEPGTHTLDVHAHFGLCSGESCALCRRGAQLTTQVN